MSDRETQELDAAVTAIAAFVDENQQAVRDALRDAYHPDLARELNEHLQRWQQATEAFLNSECAR